MIILEWETEHWLYGKDKDTIISQPAIPPLIMSIKFKTSTIQLILRDFGLISTIRTVLMKIKLSPLLNMEMEKSNRSPTRQLTL